MELRLQASVYAAVRRDVWDDVCLDDFIEPVGEHEIVGNLAVPKEQQHGRQSESIRDLNTGCFSWQKELCPKAEPCEKKQSCDQEQVFFQQCDMEQEMCEICLEVAPRDVHQQNRNGIKEWKINESPSVGLKFR